MSRKPLRRQRTGYGAFPVAGSAPVIVSITAKPLHSSDEWEYHGRPFWSVWWWGAKNVDGTHPLTSLYARTMTPTFCPLGIVGTPPVQALGVSVGACELWADAEWVEHYTYVNAERSVRSHRKYNPIIRVSWDRELTLANYQWYATAGNLGAASNTPVKRSDTEWKPPPELLQLADDGGPLAEPTDPPDTLKE